MIEVPIRGEATTVVAEYPTDVLESTSEDSIKLQMALALAKEMLNRNQIEFTKQVDAIRLKTTVRARCFCVPNDEVQILRINTKL